MVGLWVFLLEPSLNTGLIYCSSLSLAAAFTITYVIDKLLLLRFYAQPPQYDAKLAILTHKLMPMFLMAHLLLTSWMYGSLSTLYSSPVTELSRDGITTNTIGARNRNTAAVATNMDHQVALVGLTELTPPTTTRWDGYRYLEASEQATDEDDLYYNRTWNSTAPSDSVGASGSTSASGSTNANGFNILLTSSGVSETSTSPLTYDLVDFLTYSFSRVGRTTSFSHLIAFALMFIWLFVAYFATRLFHCIQNCCCKIKTKTSTNHFSPWTSDYLQPVDPYTTYASHQNSTAFNEDTAVLTKEDVELGWSLEKSLASCNLNTSTSHRGRRRGGNMLYVGRKEHLIKKWTRQEVDEELDEERKKIGMKKKTWEVCAENSIHTYRIDYNPRYADIVAEMRANMRRKDRESAAATVAVVEDPRDPEEPSEKQNETRMEERVEK